MGEKKSFFEKIGILEKVSVDNDATERVKEGREAVMPKNDESPTLNKVAAVTSNNVDSITVKNREQPGEFVKEPVVKKEDMKLFKIDEIYNNYRVKTEGVNSVFIIESFMKALPDYLPHDVKRESVLNIVSSSGLRLESLTADGNNKVKSLGEFSQSFSSNIKNAILEYEKEIRDLTEKINNCNKVIYEMKKLREEQMAALDYESARVKNILQFILPESK